MKSIMALLLAVAAGLATCGSVAAQEKFDATGKLEPIKSVTIGENSEFLVNGKPFLPIMSWAQGAKNFPMLRGLAINTFCGNSSKTGPKDHCEAAAAAGGYGVPGFGDNAQGAIGHAALLGWIHGDEPDMPNKEAKPRTSADVVVAHYQKIKEADKTRPVFVTFTGHFTTMETKYDEATRKTLYSNYVSGCDVAGFDIYPIYGSGHANHLNWPAYGTAQLKQIAGKRPVYAWIETSKGSKWMTYAKQPDVLPKHTRFEVWGALINGATAIGYFTHAWAPSFTEFAPTAEMQAELRRLNTQVTKLAPFILAPKAKAIVSMTLAGDLERGFKATELKGTLTIFAQNRDLGPDAEKLKQFDPINPRSGKATFTVAGLKSGAEIEVVDEGRTIVAEDGKFTDEFGPLAEHIYQIKQ
jgi:hypothetical protein